MNVIEGTFIYKQQIPAILALVSALLFSAQTQAGEVLYRVNAGGASLSGSPNWQIDTPIASSKFVNAHAIGNRTSSTSATVNLKHPSLKSVRPPMTLFQSERSDPSRSPNMRWKFPVISGSRYEIRLFFAEIYSRAQRVGARKFDVLIEGQVVLDDYDIFAEAGGYKGIMKSFTVTAPDDSLDIELGYVIRNPTISGIEIILVNNDSETTVSSLSNPKTAQ